MLLTCMKINTIVAIKMNDIAIGKFSRIASKTSKLYAAKPATFNTPFSPMFSSSINSPRSARTSETKLRLSAPVIGPSRENTTYVMLFDKN